MTGRRGMLPLYFPERVEGRAGQLGLDHVRLQVGKRCSANDSPGIGMVSNSLLYSNDNMKPCCI